MRHAEPQNRVQRAGRSHKPSPGHRQRQAFCGVGQGSVTTRCPHRRRCGRRPRGCGGTCFPPRRNTCLLYTSKSSSQFAYKVIINQIVGTFNLEPLFYTKKIVFSALKVKHFVNLPDFLVLNFSVAKVLCCEQKRALYRVVHCSVCVVMPAAVRGCGPVSYTHLDVYKRQGSPRTACR